MSEAIPVEEFFYLRCIAECDQEPIVQEVVDRLTRCVSAHGAVTSQIVEPFEEIPGTTDIIMHFEVGPDSEQAYGSMRDSLGSGWSWNSTDRLEAYYWASFVWNRVDGAKFVESRVRWAHLECQLRTTS